MHWLKQSSGQQAGLAVITSREDRAAIAEIIADWRCRLFDNDAFRGEIADYKRHNLTRAADGMPGFTMGFPLLLSLVAPRMIRKLNVVRKMRAKDVALLSDHTPALLMFTTPGNTPEQLLETGRLFARVALTAQRAGWQTAISALPRAGDPDASRLQRFVPVDWQAQVLCRLGKTAKRPGHSPRIALEQLLISA